MEEISKDTFDRFHYILPIDKISNENIKTLEKQANDQTILGKKMQIAAETIEPITAAVAAKSLQSCLTLCDPTDSSPPGSPVPRILQARTLEWVAISFSNA